MYRALLVCNSSYAVDQRHLPPLRGPRVDGRILGRTLTDHPTAIFESSEVKILFDVTSSEITHEANVFFSGANPDDVLLFYYSGHGASKHQRFYLCGTNTHPALLPGTAVPDTTLNAIIGESPARCKVIILDCCYSGSFKGTPLAEQLAGKGRFVLTATAPTEAAKDAEQDGSPSPFTRALVDGLTHGAGENKQDGYADLEDLYDYLQSALDGQATPGRKFDGFGKVPIAKRVAVKPAPGTVEAPPASPGATPTSDLGAVVVQAWEEFGTALTGSLIHLPRHQRVVVTFDTSVFSEETVDTDLSVSVRADAQDRLIARTASNPARSRMTRDEIAALVALGWQPPALSHGPQAQFSLTAARADAAHVATVAMRTLRDVYHAPHPAFLRYEADGEVALGAARSEETARAAPDGMQAWPLANQVAVVLAQLQKTTPDALRTDRNGDFRVPAGSAMVYVRVLDNPPLVDVFCPVLTAVVPNEALYRRLSETTKSMRIGRLYFHEGTVWASVPVFGRQFQPEHLTMAVGVMLRIVDELDDRLQREFGGRRFTDARGAGAGEPPAPGAIR